MLAARPAIPEARAGAILAARRRLDLDGDVGAVRVTNDADRGATVRGNGALRRYWPTSDNEDAIVRTVCGGTSPIAVAFCPLLNVSE